jgi:hypothetical protein
LLSSHSQGWSLAQTRKQVESPPYRYGPTLRKTTFFAPPDSRRYYLYTVILLIKSPQTTTYLRYVVHVEPHKTKSANPRIHSIAGRT